jgi:hypothetical protein
MKVAKENIGVRLELPGVAVRQHKRFGSVAGYDRISGEYFTLTRRPCSKGWMATCASVRTGGMSWKA